MASHYSGQSGIQSDRARGWLSPGKLGKLPKRLGTYALSLGNVYQLC